jgi:hypothetical protein
MIRNDNLPEYYDSMYLDGYEPWQIYEAFHRTARNIINEQRKQPEEYTVDINTNVSVKE